MQLIATKNLRLCLNTLPASNGEKYYKVTIIRLWDPTVEKHNFAVTIQKGSFIQVGQLINIAYKVE